MPQSYVTLLLVVFTLGLLIGWIFHQRQLKKSLAKLCEQVAQDQFYISLLNTILHDILNPIVAAKYTLENLKHHATTDFEPYVDQALSSVQGLSLLVQRVRYMRAFDTGKKSLQFHRTAVNRVLATVENTFKDRARAKGVKLVVQKDRTRSNVEIDPIIFQSYVLNNIIDNAIKFSKAGTTITISGYPVGNEVEFVVKDQGIGMSSESVGKLLEGKFDDICPTPNTSKGLGIGMRQVAKYLELAGGKVHVESRTLAESPSDHGTVSKITIPKTQAGQPTT